MNADSICRGCYFWFVACCMVASAGPRKTLRPRPQNGQPLWERTIPTRSSRYMPRMLCGGRCLPRYAPIRLLASDYFVRAFAALPGLKVTFGEKRVRIYGNTAVNTGYYAFSFVKDGEAKTLPARLTASPSKEGRNVAVRGIITHRPAPAAEVAYSGARYARSCPALHVCTWGIPLCWCEGPGMIILSVKCRYGERRPAPQGRSQPFANISCGPS